MRFRLYPTPEQEATLRGHCTHARFVWNLALEQVNCYRPGRPTPGYAEQNRQLSEARAAEPWLASGSGIVQQQALRDFAQAMKNFWAGTHRRPTWRKKGIHEGFRIVDVKASHIHRLNRRMGDVLIPKVGRVRFRWSRPVGAIRSFRCRACGHEAHADINAALNILAAGRAVTARGGVPSTPLSREPQLVASHAA